MVDLDLHFQGHLTIVDLEFLHFGGCNGLIQKSLRNRAKFAQNMHLTGLQSFVSYGRPWPSFSMSIGHFWHSILTFRWLEHDYSKIKPWVDLKLNCIWSDLTLTLKFIWVSCCLFCLLWLCQNMLFCRGVVQHSTLFLFYF